VKIAYVLPSMRKPSGWRTHAVSFLGAICKHVEPVLFLAEEDVSLGGSLFPGIEIKSLPATQKAAFNSRRSWGRLAAARWAIARGRFPAADLVHSLEAYPTGLVGSWLARRLGCPHVLTSHGTYGVVWRQHRIDRWAYRNVLKSAALVCPVSPGTARIMEQYFGPFLSDHRVRPILNGNDYYKLVPAEEALQRKIPALPTLLTVGDVKPRKGQFYSLAAFARVKARFPEARYFIVGSYQPNEYYRCLLALIREHQLQDVFFLGAVSENELHDLYRQASLLVLTPQAEGLHFEGFGLVYLEAGAYGLPVVATRTGGVPDAVQDGVTGLLADAGDVDGIADALLRLLSDPGLACKMGRANRRWSETLTWERNAEEYDRAYQEVLEAA
jgi:glycosyltransferase involved in cell wall biosynthesis